jgi:adenylate cyclase
VGEQDPDRRDSLTIWQRMALRRMHRRAGRRPDEPLHEEDWAAIWRMQEELVPRVIRRTWSGLPGTPRCGMCCAPFEGPGSWVVRPLGYRPSRKNPSLCATCVEGSPPGGVTMEVGVLFADLRGFTGRSEGMSPGEVSTLLRRFYGCAERVLFPEAVIDKLIGDEVMALYLPPFASRFTDRAPADVMIDHARELLRAVGYGTSEGPFVELGIGADFGKAYVGNIGDRAVFDFTAVGDTVNTASRLQGAAAEGEVVVSARVGEAARDDLGTPVEIDLKGKAEPERAFRISVGAPVA